MGIHSYIKASVTVLFNFRSEIYHKANFSLTVVCFIAEGILGDLLCPNVVS
jgi:hypothetical protein